MVSALPVLVNELCSQNRRFGCVDGSDLRRRNTGDNYRRAVKTARGRSAWPAKLSFQESELAARLLRNAQATNDRLQQILDLDLVQRMKPRQRKIYLRLLMVIPAWLLLASLIRLVRASNTADLVLYASLALVHAGFLVAFWYMSEETR